jgi:hypothetical protein
MSTPLVFSLSLITAKDQRQQECSPDSRKAGGGGEELFEEQQREREREREV